MKTFVVAVAVMLLAACASRTESRAKPGPIGMANPASVYCAKLGGKLDIVKEKDGEVGYCTLPSGERVEEWALFRRDHP